jgi:hypothetical protein
MSPFVDTNIWDFLAMPVGVLFCFGPALFVWLLAEFRSQPVEHHEDDHQGI